MNANSRQVGGDHYRTEDGLPQHWDVVDDNGIGYLEGCSSKYATRCYKKNGLQDVEKGIHYIEKLAENAIYKGRAPKGSVPLADFERFCRANNLDLRQREVCAILLGHWTPGSLVTAKAILEEIHQELTDAASDV